MLCGKKWVLCPNCNKKILIYDENKGQAQGLYIKCKSCKKVIEIVVKRAKEPRQNETR